MRAPRGRLRRHQKGVIPAKPSSYRNHVTRHGDAGNVIGLRGRVKSRESCDEISTYLAEIHADGGRPSSRTHIRSTHTTLLSQPGRLSLSSVRGR